MQASPRRRVVIVGGGITGLSVAYYLTRGGSTEDLTLLEARAAPGGNVQTEERDGFVLDTGPDSFLVTKPDALALCKELGLEGRLVATRPEARRVYFVHRGELVPMPAGMTLAVPTRLSPLVTTKLLSLRGKLRALAEPLVPAANLPDESIEEFFSRRFGPEAARRLASPLLGGVYAGDTQRLSVRATFPQLCALESRYGSLVRGYFAQAAAARGGAMERRDDLRSFLGWLLRGAEGPAESPFRSLEGGMRTLVSALARALPAGVLCVNEAVTSITKAAGGGQAYRVQTTRRVLSAEAVVLAVPAASAARLCPDAELARELSGIPYVSTATVFFAFDRGAVEHPLDGLGFVAPSGEAEILAGTWISSKWRDRCPVDAVLMRAFVGGARPRCDVETADDAELTEISLRELRRIMGRLDAPRWTRVFRYERASPQPVVGHPERMARIHSRLTALPGLYVVGAGYDGVGIPDCIRQAREVVERIAEAR